MPTWDFDTPGPARLDLELPIGRIEVETVDGEKTHVDLEGSADVRDLIETARVEQRAWGNGHEVRVEVRRRSGFFFSIGHGPDMRLRISCPPGADVVAVTKSADVRLRGRYGGVEVKTASGDVSLDTIDGDARVRTASGDVSVYEANSRTQVQTASGDVALQRSHGEVTVQAVSGDVSVKDASNSVHVNTVSGDQRLEAVTDGTVQAHSVSGDVSIGVRRGSRVYVDANTISGSTSSELDLADVPGAGDDAAESDESPMVEVRAKTVSGDISIVRAAAPAQLPTG